MQFEKGNIKKKKKKEIKTIFQQSLKITGDIVI